MRSTAQLVMYTSVWAATLGAMKDEQEQRDRFAYALRRAMQERGVSARALATAMDVDARRVAAWQKARALPNVYEAEELAALLGVRSDLFRNPPPVPVRPPEPYYPIDRYLLDAGDSGAAEGLRRVTTARPPEGRGMPARMPARRARGA